MMVIKGAGPSECMFSSALSKNFSLIMLSNAAKMKEGALQIYNLAPTELKKEQIKFNQGLKKWTFRPVSLDQGFLVTF